MPTESAYPQSAENNVIPLWEAESFGAIFTNGRTMPIQAGCYRRVGTGGEKIRGQFLLKSLGHPDVTTETSLFCEFAGNVLAQHFGIATPNPALVRMSPAFVEATRRNPEFQRISEGKIDLRSGIAVASEFRLGLAPVERDFKATLPRDVAEAARIFAFDMLVQNPDRTRKGKTNMAFSAGRMIAFDFELCFSFLFLIGGVPQPWRIDQTLAREHLLYPSLQGKVHQWQSFLDDLMQLDSDKIEQVFAALSVVFPSCHRSAEKIKEHLLSIREHSSDYKRELEKSVAS